MTTALQVGGNLGALMQTASANNQAPSLAQSTSNQQQNEQTPASSLDYLYQAISLIEQKNNYQSQQQNQQQSQHFNPNTALLSKTSFNF